MDWVELIGYAGTTLTIVAYAMRSSIRLRIAGVLSSVAFLIYGALTQSYPVLAMEAILLPLNLWRLIQMLRLRAAAQVVDESEGLNWLVPHMLRVYLRDGSRIFGDGDAADRLMVVVAGTVDWSGRTLRAGDVIGDNGLFAKGRRQMGSAIAVGAVEIAVLQKSRLAELYFDNPAFGCRLVQLLLDSMAPTTHAKRQNNNFLPTLVS